MSLDADNTKPMNQPEDSPGESKPPHAGQMVGRYALRNELGRGGQAIVFRAYDTKLSRDVALKMLPIGQSHETSLRFQREAKILSKIDAPGVCSVFDIGEDHGRMYIAMRLVTGQPVNAMINDSKSGSSSAATSIYADFDSEDDDLANSGASVEDEAAENNSTVSGVKKHAITKIVRLIESTARSLHIAHEVGLIHRDIKPSNLMVDEDGNAVILDFGLATDENSDQVTLTRTGDLMGTPAYMSPEQIAAKRITIDRRTDIYSLGVTLYECLALVRPFQANSAEQLYGKISFEIAAPLRHVNRQVPKALSNIVETAMEKDPNNRYSTAKEFADDLGRFLDNLPPLARATPLTRRIALWGTRHKRDLTLALVPLVVVLAAIWKFLPDSTSDLGPNAKNSSSSVGGKETAGVGVDGSGANEKSGFKVNYKILDQTKFTVDEVKEYFEIKDGRVKLVWIAPLFPGYIAPEIDPKAKELLVAASQFAAVKSDIIIIYPLVDDEFIPDWKLAVTAHNKKLSSIAAQVNSSPKSVETQKILVTAITRKALAELAPYLEHSNRAIAFIYGGNGVLQWGHVAQSHTDVLTFEVLLKECKEISLRK